jgi:hypothetical protein
MACGLEKSSSGERPMAGFCKNDEEPSSAILEHPFEYYTPVSA